MQRDPYIYIYMHIYIYIKQVCKEKKVCSGTRTQRAGISFYPYIYIYIYIAVIKVYSVLACKQIYNRVMPTLLSEMRICRFCKSDLQRCFAKTPKRNAQFVDFVDLSKSDLQRFFANTPERNWHLYIFTVRELRFLKIYNTSFPLIPWGSCTITSMPTTLYWDPWAKRGTKKIRETFVTAHYYHEIMQS